MINVCLWRYDRCEQEFDGECVTFRLNGALKVSGLAVICEWLVVSILKMSFPTDRRGFGKEERRETADLGECVVVWGRISIRQMFSVVTLKGPNTGLLNLL